MNTHQPYSVRVSASSLRTIARRLGLPHARCEPFLSPGAGNALYAIGDRYLLRVPHSQPHPVVHREVAAVAAARAAGVHTPAVTYQDASCTLLPVPFAVYERVAGIPLSALAPVTGNLTDTWQAVGQELARLHTGVTAESEAGRLALRDDALTPHSWLRELRDAGRLAAVDFAWLEHWQLRLWPFVLAQTAVVFCHGDMNAANIMVDAESSAYLALIDWGGVVWADPAWDFVPLPLAAVPPMLEGYRALAPLPRDAEAEARILAYRLLHAIWWLRLQPSPAVAAARVANLRADMAAFLQQPRAGWIAQL